MDISPESMSHLADIIIVTVFFMDMFIAYGFLLCELVSMVTDKVRSILKKRKEKKESDENRIIEH